MTQPVRALRNSLLFPSPSRPAVGPFAPCASASFVCGVRVCAVDSCRSTPHSKMGKGPGHNNKGKRGHKLSHKSARRIKSALAPADLMWEAFHAPQEIKVRGHA
jgi:hypothetical protein